MWNKKEIELKHLCEFVFERECVCVWERVCLCLREIERKKEKEREKETWSEENFSESFFNHNGV